ncbi:MAG: transporter substrate-binding domain-containing protein [Roseobacter sp.]
MIRSVLFCLVLLSVFGSLSAPVLACPHSRPEGDIVVALRSNAQPFSYFEPSGEPAGFAYDLWRRVERSLSVMDDAGRSVTPQVTFVNCETIDAQEVSLVTGRIDVVISPLTITGERMRSYDFSQQYLSSGLALALPPTNAIDFSRAKDIVGETLLHPSVAQAVVGFLAFNLLMALLIRHLLLAGKNEDAPRSTIWLRSLLESIIRTIGLRGVGDNYSTAMSKVLEIFLAVVGTALSATLLGVLTSAFVGSVGTQNHVSAADLTTMSLATLDCSTAQALLLSEYRQRLQNVDGESEQGLALKARIDQLICRAEDPERDDITVDDHPALKGSVVLVSSWAQAARLLSEGEVGGVLGDWVALTYLSRNNTYRDKIEVLPTVYRNEPYGWGISRMSVSEDLRRQIDRALIQQMRNRNWRKNLEDVLGDGSVSPN